MRAFALILILACSAAFAGTCRDEGVVAASLCAWGAARVEAPDRYEIESWRLDGADSNSVRSLELVEADGPNRSGYVRLTLSARLADGRTTDARATLRGRVRGPALVVARTLRQREAVPEEAVERVDSDLTTLHAAPLRAIDELAGRVPARTLAVGRVLDESVLQAEPAVRRGQPTRAIYRRGPLRISISGTALADGAPGETVPFKRASGSGRLSGTVQRDGTIAIGGRP